MLRKEMVKILEKFEMGLAGEVMNYHFDWECLIFAF